MLKKILYPYLILLLLLSTFSSTGTAFSGDGLPQADLPYKINLPLILNNFDPAQAVPVIFTHPVDQFVSERGTASFTVAAGGMAPLSYQWQRSNNGSTVWANVGTDSAAYSLNATQADSGARFRCLVTNTAGSATSNAATLTVTGCYTLNLEHTGLGMDPVASPANSPGCATDQYAAGATVNLNGAVPTSGWQISSWTGTNANGSTASTNSLTMPAAAHTVFVNYTQVCYLLTLSHTGQGSNPSALPAYANGCSAGYYVAGSTVNLNGAAPDSGWHISGWTGTNNNGSTASNNSLTMPAAAHSASVIYTQDSSRFAFVVTTDWHTSSGQAPVETNLQQIRAWIDNPPTGWPAPSFLVITGDFPNVSQTQGAITNVLGPGFLWYPVIGNHEVDDGISNFIAVRDTLVPSRPNIVNHGPTGSVNTSYSWTYGNAHFTAINDLWDGNTTAGADSAREGDIVPALRAWIDADLASSSQTHKFAFVHEPAYPLDRHVGDSLDKYAANRNAFVSSLDSGGVQTLFVGHTHYYRHTVASDNPNYTPLGNVHQVTNGRFPGGADTSGSTITYVLIDGGTATYRVYHKVDGTTAYYLRDTWTITP